MNNKRKMEKKKDCLKTIRVITEGLKSNVRPETFFLSVTMFDIY
jgi:hypothetical protein